MIVTAITKSDIQTRVPFPRFVACSVPTLILTGTGSACDRLHDYPFCLRQGLIRRPA